MKEVVGNGWLDHDPPEYSDDGRVYVYRGGAVGLATLDSGLVLEWSPVEVLPCTCEGVGFGQHLTTCPVLSHGFYPNTLNGRGVTSR